MKSSIITARAGKKIRLSEIDPDDTGGTTKEEALERIQQSREKLCLLQQAFYAEHERSC